MIYYQKNKKTSPIPVIVIAEKGKNCVVKPISQQQKHQFSCRKTSLLEF